MKTINIFGSTGSIGTKSLKIIKNYFPKIKINLIVANNNYKKLLEQARIYKPKYICLVNQDKYKKFKKSINNKKIKIISKKELSSYLKDTKSDLTILSISGYSSLNYIQSIIINTKLLGIVNKECIIAGGSLVKKLCLLNNTKLYALDSEHFSIQNYFNYNTRINKDSIKNVFLTASGGPFLNKKFKDIKFVSLKEAIKHPKWSMGIKNSVDSANLVNKCLEIIEAYYLFEIQFNKLKILIHPESLIHSIIEFKDFTSNLNYFYHDMFIPIFNFIKTNHQILNKEPFNNNLNFNKNMNLTFCEPNYSNFPIMRIFNEMDKYKHKNIINFNTGNELAVKLFAEGRINFGYINKIIEKSLNIDFNVNLNSIENIILYQKEFGQTLNSKITIKD